MDRFSVGIISTLCLSCDKGTSVAGLGAVVEMSNFALNRTIASCYDRGSTHIPLPKTYGKMNNCPDMKFKMKFEEAERQRKLLLTQNEKSEFF